MTTINSIGRIDKGWGHEQIWASTPFYCGKFMHFNKNAKFSMHFHRIKRETWYVLNGEFIVQYINTYDATIIDKPLKIGDTWTNDPLVPHRLICLEAGTIIEVSTADDPADNYRVAKGDSQLKELN